MPEYVPPADHPFKRGSPGALSNPTSLRYELSLLIATFLADKSVYEIADFDDHRPISRLWREFTEDSILSRLASTASLLRAKDDFLAVAVEENDANPNNEFGKKLRARSCGTLQPDLRSGDTIDLTLREACNKIMHATRCHFDVIGKDPTSYLGHFVYLYGSKNKINWRAELDVIKYVEVGAIHTEWL